jgi:predicted permease
MSWLRRFANLLRPNRLGRDIDREMHFHVEELVDDLVARGMPDEDARREARRRFGHHQVLKERVREVDLPSWLDAIQSDARYAVRGLLARPGFTTVIVVSLALGIGANTAIYSLINAVMLRSLPVRDPESLVQVIMADSSGTFTNPLWESLRDQQKDLDGVLAYSDRTFNLSTGGVARRVPGAWVSGDYFNVLGVRPAHGRLLSPADDLRGCPGAAVLSEGFWQSEYGGAPDVVGRTISLDGNPFEIVGVSAAGFSGVQVGRSHSVFVPLCTAETLGRRGMLDGRSSWYLNILGRLKPDVPFAQARTGLATIARSVFEPVVPEHWTAAEQEEFRASGLTIRPAAGGLSSLRGQYRDALNVLFVVVGVVLLIACGNVAQLLLARSATREHELAVRLALGSGRGRLMRQVLTESVLLSLLGAALGLLFARWATGLIVALMSRGRNPVSLDLSLDPRVLGFTMLVAIATGVLFGLLPAWRSGRVDPQGAMRGAGRGTVGDTRRRGQRFVVATQLALSLVLVVAAGLLMGSFRRLNAVDPGFSRDNVLLVKASWSSIGLDSARQQAQPREFVQRMRGLPGVQSAAASLVTPISGSFWNEFMQVDGFVPKSERDALVWFNAVTDGYLDVLQTRLIAGRDLSPQDRRGSQRVAVVNEAMARHFFGEVDPVGRVMRTDLHGTHGPPITIVGVMEDAKYASLSEEARPSAYVPLDQEPLWGPEINVALRFDGSVSALVPAVTRAFAEADPAIMLEVATLDGQVSASLARPRTLAMLSSFFGVLALLLAIIGLYGVISYGVTRRRDEIGVRIALGASRQGVLRMVAAEAGGMVALGVVIGVPLTLASVRLLAAFLYGVTPTDAATLAGAAAVLAVVAMGAGAVPAWRAASVDPMVALRKE